MSFSPDGKMLVAQGGAPEWNLVLWLWEKSKVASSVKSTNQQGAPLHGVSRAREQQSGPTVAPLDWLVWLGSLLVACASSSMLLSVVPTLSAWMLLILHTRCDAWSPSACW